MINGLISKNVSCVLDEMTVTDTSDGFYNHHFEQWNLVSRETKNYVGFVTFEVTRNGEKYDMLFTVVPYDNDKVQGFDHVSRPCSRVELLNKAIDFIKNN